MHRAWLVIKFEFLSVVLSPAFIFLLLFVPLFPFVIYSVMTLSSPQYDASNQSGSRIFQLMMEPEAATDMIGLVDEGGIVRVIPTYLQDWVRVFDNPLKAQNAFELGEISSIYVLPVDYLEKGEVAVFLRDSGLISSYAGQATLSEVLFYNLLGGNAALAERFMSPLQYEETSYLNVKPVFDPQDPQNVLVLLSLFFFLFLAIYGSASLMLSGLTKEKQNRIVEILLTSITTA